MKVRVQRTGLLGIVRHEKGKEMEIKPEEYRPTWMQPLDDEAKEYHTLLMEELEQQNKAKRVDEIAKLKLRLAELERGQAPKDVKSRVVGEVL